MNSGTTNSNHLLRLDPSVYDQFAPASDHIDTVQLVGRHIESHLGSVKHIVRYKNPAGFSTDIQIVPPTLGRNYYTLVSSGMSDKPMTTPANLHQYRYAELYMHMPDNWKHDPGEPNADLWPIDLMLKLAQLPHNTASWLGYGCCISFEELASPTRNAFTSVLLASSLYEHEQFQTLQASPSKRIHFYNVCPLYAEEQELVQLAGATYQEDLFILKGLTGAVDFDRKSVLSIN